MRGNSLVEYLLPAALVVFVALVGCTVMAPDMKKFIQLAFNSSSTSASETDINIQSLGSNPALKTVTVTLADGTVLNLDNFPSSVSFSIEAVGAEGTTELLLASLESVINQLRDKDKITEAEANQLRDLANKGHDLAKVQGLIEDAADRSQGNLAAYNQKFSLDGQNLISVKDLNAQMFIYGGSDAIPFEAGVVPLNNQTGQVLLDLDTKNITHSGLQGVVEKAKGDINQIKVGMVLNNFLESFAASKNSNALRDPAIKSLVTKLSESIYMTSLGVSLTSAGISNGTIPVDNLQNTVASTLTHLDSGGICTTGNNQDTGVRCK